MHTARLLTASPSMHCAGGGGVIAAETSENGTPGNDRLCLDAQDGPGLTNPIPPTPGSATERKKELKRNQEIQHEIDAEQRTRISKTIS